MNEDELLAELEDRLDNPPRYWTPEGVPSGLDEEQCVTAEKVYGLVESIEERDDDYKGHLTVVIKQADSSRLQIQGYGKILAARFAELNVGDGLAIAFRGRFESQVAGFKPYLGYRVERIAANPGDPGRLHTTMERAESEASLNGNSLQGEGASDSVPHPAETA